MRMPRMGVRSGIVVKARGAPSKEAAIKRMAFALVFALATAMALAAGPAGAATTSTTYDVPTATAPLLCTDCGPQATYTITYTGNGTCSATCAGFPVDPADLALTFAVARFFPPSPCMMKSGTGTLSASWPSDPSLPTAQGTFTFKARDSHIVDFSGSITASALSALPVGDALGGSVTFPPSPCTGAPPKPSSASGGKPARGDRPQLKAQESNGVVHRVSRSRPRDGSRGPVGIPNDQGSDATRAGAHLRPGAEDASHGVLHVPVQTNR